MKFESFDAILIRSNKFLNCLSFLTSRPSTNQHKPSLLFQRQRLRSSSHIVQFTFWAEFIVLRVCWSCECEIEVVSAMLWCTEKWCSWYVLHRQNGRLTDKNCPLSELSLGQAEVKNQLTHQTSANVLYQSDVSGEVRITAISPKTIMGLPQTFLKLV